MSKKKYNLILDLDQTIISGEPIEDLDLKNTYKEKHKLFRFDNMEDYYNIYSRPHLQNFLDYAFANFNVTVWTAASKDYALFIIENIIINNKPERKLDFIFFEYHCHLSKKIKKYSKELCMLWDIHKLPGYSHKNTVIIDDYKQDVHKCQPNNCIIAPPFEFKKYGSENDTFLKDIIPEIEKMKTRMDTDDIDITNEINFNMKTIKKKKLM
jgi:hypothetical protein